MSRTQRLLVVLALNLALVVGLAAVGVSAHSLAVLAEGGDYLLDAVGVGVALFAIPVLLDTTADAAAAAGAAAAGGIILVAGGWYWLDPAVALSIAIIVAYHAFALIRKILNRKRSAGADTVGH